MTAIQRGDLADAQAFRCRDHRRVHCPKRQIAVSPHKLRDTRPVARWHRLNEEMAGCEIPQKLEFGSAAEAVLDQVDNLTDHEMGNDQRARMRFEQFPALCVVAITTIYRSVERA
jgi:hypothetical protein